MIRWRRWAVYVGAICVLSVLCTGEAPRAQESKNDQHQGEAADQHQPTQAPASKDAARLPNEVGPLVQEKNSATDIGKHEEADKDGKHGWLYTFFADIKITDVVIALFTVILAAYTRGLHRSTAGLLIDADTQVNDLKDSIRIANESANAARLSADIAKATMISNQRPWLKIRVELSDQPLVFGNGGVQFGVSLFLHNIGNAPALNVTLSAWLLTAIAKPGRSHYEQHGEKCIEERRATAHMSYTLFPGDNFPDITGGKVFTIGLNLSQADVEEGVNAVRRGLHGAPNIMLFIGGCVTYDVPSDLEQRRQTDFLMQLQNNFNVSFAARGPTIPIKDLQLMHLLGGRGGSAD